MPISPVTKLLFFDALCFQAIWWLGVLGGNQTIPFSGLIILLRLYVNHKQIHTLRQELRALSYLLPIGLLLDLTLWGLGIFSFTTLPYWLGMIWIAFILSLHLSLRWLLQSPPWMIFSLASIAGPLSYWAGMRFEAVEFPLGLWPTLAILALIWGCVMLLFYRLLPPAMPMTQHYTPTQKEDN